MSQINVRNLSNENEDGAPNIVGVSTFSATSYFVPPKGTTAQRPTNPQPGDLRFNTDSASLEYFKGDVIGWSQIEMTSPDLDGGARALFAGGLDPGNSDVIDYITIPTLGNTTDFGNLTEARQAMGGCASRTRSLNLGGYTSSFENVIDYETFSSIGNALDFGDLTQARNRAAGCGNQTRGIAGGGNIPGGSSDVIEYITIAQTGNGVDFGNLTVSRQSTGSFASSVRGIFAGGYHEDPSATFETTIDYITIESTGNAADFGDLTVGRLYAASCSNSTRGVMGGGNVSGGTQKNEIDYITIATLGNALDFGDLTAARRDIAAASSPTRGVFCGGDTPTLVNTIDYVEILTTGNAVDFGDQTVSRDRVSGTSNAHGGL